MHRATTGPIRRIRPEARKAAAAAFLGAISVAMLGIVASAGPPQAKPTSGTSAQRPSAAGAVEIQMLGVNDFHGRLESPKALPRKPGERPVALGGAAALDAHLDRAARSHPGRTIRVHAGDMVGASPLLSSYFHDEPTVRAMNLMDFDVGTLGNHEFDEGGEELVRLLRGGRRRDGLEYKRDESGRLANTSAPDFEGVDFPYIAANSVDREGRLALPPTKIVERAGVRIGFIGVTTLSTPHHLLAEHSERFDWRDISTVVNRHAAKLQRQGVEAIVVLAHSGAKHEDKTSGAAAGEIVDEAREMSGAVDVVIAGHTHSYLNARVRNREGAGDKLLVEARSFGIAYDRVRMTVDRSSGEVIGKSADTPSTWVDQVAPDPDVGALVARYRRALGGLGDRVVGRAASPLLRNRLGAATGSIGTLAARAQRRMARADIAFVQEGNARGDVDAGPVTYAELFEASAYEHPVMRMTMSGRGVRRVLEEQYEASPDAVLHVDGLTYERRGEGVGAVLLADGRALEPDGRYTVAANRLLTDHEGFGAFRRHGEGMRAVGTDLEALVAEVERAGVVE